MSLTRVRLKTCGSDLKKRHDLNLMRVLTLFSICALAFFLLLLQHSLLKSPGDPEILFQMTWNDLSQNDLKFFCNLSCNCTLWLVEGSLIQLDLWSDLAIPASQLVWIGFRNWMQTQVCFLFRTFCLSSCLPELSPRDYIFILHINAITQPNGLLSLLRKILNTLIWCTARTR